MKYSLPQYAQALHEAFADSRPRDHDAIIANFIAVLKRNGDLAHYESVITAYEQYDKTQKGIKDVELTTAGPLEVSQSLIKKLNDIVGQEVAVKQKLDPALIGGVVLRVDDTLLDASVQSHLSRLKKTLTNN